MRKILITGANSYIGMSFEKWMKQWKGEYSIETIDMIGETWKEKSFSEYDTVFHVAGIAHSSSNPKLKDLYMKVNCNLTIETAKKAKADGVKQFIFMSSIIVYGDSGNIYEKKVIDRNTIPVPDNFYGNSKLQAEQGILPLMDDTFHVTVLRPPMIFGKGSKGNYPKLANMAKKSPLFFDIENERSMLYIENLCEFVRLMIKNEERGIFFPQNDAYVSTSELVRLIAKAHGSRIRLTKVFNPLLRFTGKFIGPINKIFGNLIYEKEMSEYKENYRVKTLQQAIRETEE